jgi:hypothetical protein
MIRRFVFQWFTCRDRSRPSGRAWARALGVSHTWLQNLVREFMVDPGEMWRLRAANGDPKFAELSSAKEDSLDMRVRGELRLSSRANRAKFFERYRHQTD